MALGKNELGGLAIAASFRPVLVAVIANFSDKHRIVQNVPDGASGENLASPGLVAPGFRSLAIAFRP